MVKNRSRKIKKKGGDKHHLGGERPFNDGRELIPTNIVPETRSIYEKDNNPNVTVEPNPGKKEEAVDPIPPSTDGVESKPTESDELQFQFTRHVLSCNNLDEGKWYTGGKDFEPGATAYGIEKTIEYAKDSKQTPYFNFDHVYVSNLYRTWITAVLLYGTNLQSSDTLNLYISPYLKEYHKIILGQPLKRGNFPKEINHMANKFLNFLNTLKTLLDDINAEKMREFARNQPERELKKGVPLPRMSVAQSKIPVKRLKPIPEKKKNEDEDEDEDTQNGGSVSIPSDWYVINLPNNIILHLPPKENSDETQKITYTKDGVDEYKVKSFCDIQDTAGPNSGHEFIETGNLQKFMEWYNGNSEITNYYGRYNKDKKVHIVTHSHIMREYLMNFKVKTSGGDDDYTKRAFRKAMDKELSIYKNTGRIKRLVTDFKHLYRLQEIFNTTSLHMIEFDLDLLQYYDYKGDKEPGPIYPIRNSNCWHFITTVNKKLEDESVNGAIKEFKIQAGVPIRKKIAKNMEDKTPNSLCGEKGSVGPMNTTCSVGGRKTGRRYIRRTKKRSKRKNNKSRKHHK